MRQHLTGVLKKEGKQEVKTTRTCAGAVSAELHNLLCLEVKADKDQFRQSLLSSRSRPRDEPGAGPPPNGGSGKRQRSMQVPLLCNLIVLIN
jgi:hypothetical protein